MVEASGHYLEDYLQYIKTLPNDLQRTFALMAELDQKAEDIKSSAESGVEEVLQLANDTKSEPTEEQLRLIRDQHNEAWALSVEKIHLATQAREIIDSFVSRLDEDMKRFEVECGIDNLGEPPEDGAPRKKEKRSATSSGRPRSPQPRSSPTPYDNRSASNMRVTTTVTNTSGVASMHQIHHNGHMVGMQGVAAPGVGVGVGVGGVSMGMTHTHMTTSVGMQPNGVAMTMGHHGGHTLGGMPTSNVVGGVVGNPSNQMVGVAPTGVVSNNNNNNVNNGMNTMNINTAYHQTSGMTATYQLPSGVGYTGQPMGVVMTNPSSSMNGAPSSSSAVAVGGPPRVPLSNGNGSEQLYCLCQQVSWGEMVGCDNPNCRFKWFHFGCVGLKKEPKGKWYCEECTTAATRT